VGGNPPSNGILIGGVRILCSADSRTLPFLYWFAKGVPNALWPGPEQGPTVLTVSSYPDGRVLATKRFRRRSQAMEVRTVLIAAIERMDPGEVASTDWQILIDAI
jgi:hypothetical protein